MEIKLAGKSSLVLKSKKEVLAVINPNREIDLEKLNPKVVGFNSLEEDYLGLDDKRLVLKGTGEYEVGGVDVSGVSAGKDRVIYIFNIEGVSVGVLGYLDEPLSEKKTDKIEAIDVLAVYLGGQQKAGGKDILGWAKKWGVNYLLPIAGAEGESLVKFLDSADQEGLEPTESLKVEKSELPEGMEIVVLKEA
jgi:hypothetical protein